MNVTRYCRLGVLGLVLFGVLGCTPSAPSDGGPPPPNVDLTPKSSDEAAAEQAKTASKRP